MAATAPDRNAQERDWTRFAYVLGAAAGACFLLLMAFLLAVDPYDSGRTGILGRSGLPDQSPTTANASRARDPAFNAAIFGNSHVQQLSPDRLNAQTGLAFVSLTIPGTGPADHLAVVRRFLATHTSPPKAIVIGVDGTWCRAAFSFLPRFPVWLYDPSLLNYVTGLVRYRSIEAAISRLAFLRTGRGGARRDGYWDYQPVFARMGLDDAEASRKRVLEDKASAFDPNPSAEFPAFGALRTVLNGLPRGTTIVLVRPPVYESALPQPETPSDITRQDCSKAIDALSADYPNVRVIDLLKHGPIAADVANFYDLTHYRDSVAVAIENMVADRLKRG